ncbi:hypothetical protein IB237_24265 [Agrobacterium sp. AGB01]|jgi:hypothetical protein|uniref:PP_RS20740 family protein n=1 Tax=Agrobacterium sp. AGB01 TaxID=2769302 RepID=UPI00177F8906|nr:hypothetical protein [Agrobacterium sp. AGB01]MBD9390321.1 hypothetical protein [Agrobacterium sp. AGB01]
MNTTDDDDFSDSVLPPEASPLASPEPLQFEPWHKPRKQYVRVEQWLRHVEGIFRTLGPQSFVDGEPLRYMTLPGPDLLDIRMVADFCSSKSIKLRYTGFCHSTDTEERRLRQNVNEFSLTHKESVVSSSKVVRSRLQDVGIKNSEAAIEMVKGGPFDIINIDACEPLAGDDENASGRLVDAIRSITAYQLANRRKSWILFLTTPIQADSISKSSMAALNEQVVINTKNDELFAEELSTRFETGEDVAAYLDRVSKDNGDVLLSVFSLGISKWLIHLAEQATFKVKKLKGYSYSMFRKPPYDANMVSLCFLFEPNEIVIQDGTGLTGNPPAIAANGDPAISLHVRALRKSFEIENLDTKLRANKSLHDEMVAQSKEILKRVGYPVDDAVAGYDAWLVTKEQIFSDENQPEKQLI